MAQDWKAQLQSDNPRVRVEAIKALANSGDRANLPYLKEVVEKDPDPRLRDYARKAARHLFTSTEEAAPEQAASPESSPPAQVRETEAPDPQAAPPLVSTRPAERTAAETKIQRALSLHMRGTTPKALKSFVQGLDLDPNLANETFTRSVASELTGLDPDQAIAILMDPEERKDLLNPPKDAPGAPGQAAGSGTSPAADQPPKERTGLIQTWLSFFSMSEDFLAEEARYANTEDSLLSILVITIASVVSVMISGTIQFQQVIPALNEQLSQMGEAIPPLDINFGVIFLGMLIGTAIFTPIGFFLGVGIQFLGARLFGGSGDFKSHLYLMAVIQVPVTVLGGVTSILTNIPLLGFVVGLAGFGVSIYALVLLVRAIKAVHSLPTGRAVAGLLLPPIIVVVVLGCLLTIFGSALGGLLTGMG